MPLLVWSKWLQAKQTFMNFLLGLCLWGLAKNSGDLSKSTLPLPDLGVIFGALQEPCPLGLDCWSQSRLDPSVSGLVEVSLISRETHVSTNDTTSMKFEIYSSSDLFCQPNTSSCCYGFLTWAHSKTDSYFVVHSALTIDLKSILVDPFGNLPQSWLEVDCDVYCKFYNEF